jgi:hypothetical protein
MAIGNTTGAVPIFEELTRELAAALAPTPHPPPGTRPQPTRPGTTASVIEPSDLIPIRPGEPTPPPVSDPSSAGRVGTEP